MTKDFFIAEKIGVGKNKRKYSLVGGIIYQSVRMAIKY